VRVSVLSITTWRTFDAGLRLFRADRAARRAADTVNAAASERAPLLGDRVSKRRVETACVRDDAVLVDAPLSDVLASDELAELLASEAKMCVVVTLIRDLLLL
jgi:hypothetical protein